MIWSIPPHGEFRLEFQGKPFGQFQGGAQTDLSAVEMVARAEDVQVSQETGKIDQRQPVEEKGRLRIHGKVLGRSCVHQNSQVFRQVEVMKANHSLDVCVPVGVDGVQQVPFGPTQASRSANVDTADFDVRDRNRRGIFQSGEGFEIRLSQEGTARRVRIGIVAHGAFLQQEAAGLKPQVAFVIQP